MSTRKLGKDREAVEASLSKVLHRSSLQAVTKEGRAAIEEEMPLVPVVMSGILRRVRSKARSDPQSPWLRVMAGQGQGRCSMFLCAGCGIPVVVCPSMLAAVSPL